MKKKRKYSLGGDLLQTGVSFIPGVGQILSPLVGLVDDQIDKSKVEELKPIPPIQMNQNPFGKLALGGIINDNFKQYNTGSHESGNDLPVDSTGTPNGNSANTVQNKENSFKVGDKQYVFSDVLKKNGISFNRLAMKINKKYPKARFIPDQQAALDLEMTQLAKDNDMARENEVSRQFAKGGFIDGPGDRVYVGYDNDLEGDLYYDTVEDEYYQGGKNAPKGSKLYGIKEELKKQYGTTAKPIPAGTINPWASFNNGKTNTNSNLSIPPSSNIAWQAQSLRMPNIPVLSLPTTVQSDQMDFKTMDNSPLEQGLDTTTFGTPINSIGKNLNDLSNSSSPVNSVVDGSVITPKQSTSNVLSAKAANTVGLGLKGLALAGSVMDALSPAEREKLITPDYTKSDADLRAANIDYTQAKQDAIGVSNIAAGTNRSLSSNAASFQGREMARFAQLSDQLGRISEAQNNAQSGINLQRGQIENNRALDLANRQYQNQQGNMQNQAMSRYAGRQLAADLASVGSSFNQYAESQKAIQNQKELNQFATSQTLAILGNKYPNFKLNPQIIERFKKGEIDLDQFLQYVPSDAQAAIKTKVKGK